MRRSTLALVLTLLAASPATAQEALSMDAAVDEALMANPSLRASVLAARSAARLVRQQESLYHFVLQLDGTATIGNTPQLSIAPTIVYPYTESVELGAQITRAFPWGTSITLRVDASRIFSRRFFTPMSGGMGGLVTTGPGYGLGLELTVSQSLLRGLGEQFGLATLYQARAEQIGADRTRDRDASALVRDLLSAYWELWYAERVIAVERSARDLSARLVEEAEQRATLGALAPADTLSLETQVATAASRIASAELAGENARTTLASLLGRTGTSLPSTNEEPPRLAPVAVSDAARRAIESAPEVIEAEAQLESARVLAGAAGASATAAPRRERHARRARPRLRRHRADLLDLRDAHRRAVPRDGHLRDAPRRHAAPHGRGASADRDPDRRAEPRCRARRGRESCKHCGADRSQRDRARRARRASRRPSHAARSPRKRSADRSVQAS